MFRFQELRLAKHLEEKRMEAKLFEQARLEKRKITLEEVRKHIFFQKTKILLKKQQVLLVRKYMVFQQKLNQYYFFFLRTRLKKKL